MAKKWVYMFTEGGESMRDLLGGKGAGLAEMTRAGLPVPPGFTITTEACNEYFKKGRQFPEGMWEQTLEALRKIEEETGKKFGDPSNPLLVSVRSGAKVSMPGMMDTVLNLGLNDETLKGLAKLTQNERFAYDAYRRFIQMFGRIVMKVPGEKFDEAFERIKEKYGAKKDTDLGVEALKEVVEEFKRIYKEHIGEDFPSDPYEQLRKAIAAVFESWFGKRAVDYRNFYGIPHDWGTAVNIVTMVFGNMGDDSGTGVAFTRDPATGEKILWGEYLTNAQGEDVVAGIRTPYKIEELKEKMPEIYEQLVKVSDLLERHYKDMQDMEFTVERGKLWMLQTRAGKRTAKAAVKIAVDMAKEGIISKEEAIMRVTPEQVDQLLHPRFDEKAKEKARADGRYLAKGLNASPGAATGIAVFDADTAEELGKKGESVILVRPETSPDDVHGMLVAKGILTQHGGATSHAAVVARGLGKPCVAGCEAIRIDLSRRLFTVNDKVIREGDVISIDGSTGEVFVGAIPTIEPKLEEEEELLTLLSWADEVRRLGVWANADYPRDAKQARDFGAEGIGLCRTEHMFFEPDRLPIVHQMILAETLEEREAALNKLLPIQKEDFKGIFRVMEGLPVIIRLIDPPLHEFLPKYEDLVAEVTELRVRLEYEKDNAELKARLAEKEALLRKVAAMREANPMLGFRGVRLGVLWPEINRMQVRAIIEAACELTKEGLRVYPEIMIPVTANANELKILKELVDETARKVMEEQGVTVHYKFGTMIEIPRAALTAAEFAKYAEFFSFGTNDLTQTVYGISRDDAEGKFLLAYVEKGVIPANPFQTLDREGVGRIMRMCVEEARQVRPDIEIGICGEHGGDPASIEFCHLIGLNYVSCSPFRVPIARLAAAQAALQYEYGLKKKIIV